MQPLPDAGPAREHEQSHHRIVFMRDDLHLVQRQVRGRMCKPQPRRAFHARSLERHHWMGGEGIVQALGWPDLAIDQVGVHQLCDAPHCSGHVVLAYYTYGRLAAIDHVRCRLW